MTFQRILVPTDFSPSAAKALDVARTAFGGTALRLLHVLDARAVAVPDLTTGGVAPVMPSPDVLRQMEQADLARIEKLVRPGEEYEVLMGDPVAGILSVARGWGADLIVMGTHGRRGLAHFLMGSVTERVVREAPVPVLTVRE